MTSRIITLTTDFGTIDAYVAIMKGVILSIAPDTTLVDLSHDVRPQNVTGAAFLLRSSYRYFPSETIHLAVVDPGVGTSRKAIAISTPHGCYVGPDNGLFGPVLTEQGVMEQSSGELNSDAIAVELTARSYWLDHISQTFHGRDIFAPAAAHLANSTAISELGDPIRQVALIDRQAPMLKDGDVYGTIIHIDHFGNAITNVPARMIPESCTFEVGGRVLKGLSSSYQEARVVALIGSTGLLEVAARNASAADTLGLRVGDAVTVRRPTPD
jgi:S-adenosyl-L-methionine hydrolase (adenosine-forming)